MKTKIAAFSLFLIGVFILSYLLYLLWQRNIPVNTDLKNFSSRESGELPSPIKIEIPSLEILLPITISSYTDGKWSDPGNTVAYWKDSPLPGSQGNSVFYGHNRPNVLGKIKKLSTGDKIMITFSDDSKKEFRIVQKQTVTADQTHVLGNSEDIRVTLYTCTGFLDSKRLVFTAIPEN